ncbi:MAG TPA: hypothetical protein VNT57_01835 [Desulfobacteria bacterium]|nr:hypothetical protein [Desulfobacteria bacterium]
MSDGLVNGSISSNSTKATVSADVSCINSVPTGSIEGTFQFFGGSSIRHFKFASDSPLIVATIRQNDVTSVGAVFDDVSVQENEFTPITGGTAFLNATRLTSTTWIGAITICSSDGKRFFFYGTFTGNTTVNRQVFCQPLL